MIVDLIAITLPQMEIVGDRNHLGARSVSNSSLQAVFKINGISFHEEQSVSLVISLITIRTDVLGDQMVMP
jgi:hypothetical protein